MSTTCKRSFCGPRVDSRLTIHEIVHSQDTGENSLVVAVEQASNTGETGNTEDSEILNQSHGP